MKKILFIETGTGIDVHGQDVNIAACRAVENAIHYNSMPGIENILPSGNLEQMKVHVKLAVPKDLNKIDEKRIKALIPYGTVTVEVLKGGMATSSGIVLKDQLNKNDLMYIINAAIEVGY